MIRVGFFLSSIFPDEYAGGKNYIKNLLFALSHVDNREIECVFFIGKKISANYENEFKPYGTIVRTSLLDRGSPFWVLDKIFFKYLNSRIITFPLIRKNKIAIMSHSDIYGKKVPFKTINWVPDLQFLHLPQIWSENGLKNEQKRFKDRLELSDRIIFSSNDGQKDGLAYVPHKSQNFLVIRPVYQIDCKIYERSDLIEDICNYYGIQKKFFHLPNQFWTHKNHMIVFKAVNLLKQRGIEIQVVCTGLMENADSPDRGFSKNMDSIRKYINDNKLEENVKFLGLIKYDHVQFLMRNSISVINPSLFEGWSSTVEECKSMGKSVILSNLNVHKEQDPPGAIFFDPYDSQELAKILADRWVNSSGSPELELERKARENMAERTRFFGEAYNDAILKLAGN